MIYLPPLDGVLSVQNPGKGNPGQVGVGGILFLCRAFSPAELKPISKMVWLLLTSVQEPWKNTSKAGGVKNSGRMLFLCKIFVGVYPFCLLIEQGQPQGLPQQNQCNIGTKLIIMPCQTAGRPHLPDRGQYTRVHSNDHPPQQGEYPHPGGLSAARQSLPVRQ
jgi:hypothetical protein